MHARTVPTSAHETGRRLKIARENARFTQADAARKINIARTTLVAIEQGLRRARTHELLQLAKAYGVTANEILRREAVFVDLIPRFRKLNRARSEAVDAAAQLLSDFVRAEVELENALGVKRTFDYPRQRPLQIGPVKEQAEEDALELRRWLGLGIGPVLDVLTLMEVQLGIRVYSYPIDSRISGIFAWDEALGACTLLCSTHRPDRIQFTAAHELGHFLTARATPGISQYDREPSSRLEKYANHFASAFLMPRGFVAQRFAEVTEGQTHLTRRHIILLSQMFGVSRVALVRRLEELQLVRPKTWEWFQENGGITDQQAEQVTGYPSPLAATNKHCPVPIRIALLVREAWARELYSEGQLSRMLKLHRHEIRKLVYEVPTPNSEINKLLH